MRKLFCLTVMVVFCLTLLSYVSVNAQEQAEFKVAPAGSVFNFKVKEPGLFSDNIYENKMTILSVDSITIKYQSKAPTYDNAWDLYAFTMGSTRPQNLTLENIEKIKGLFPLRVGKKVIFEIPGRQSSTTYIAEVVKIEEAKVPAGTFKTFVIETTMQDLPWFFGTQKYWYSPEIGWYVKSSWVASRKNGNDENRTRELLSYTLKK